MEKHKNILANRILWVLVIAMLIILPLWGIKTMILKEYDSKQHILTSMIEETAVFVWEGQTYHINKSEWQYIGIGDTDMRPQWGKGGYMVNLYGIAVRDSIYFIIAVSMDDKAREIYREPWEIRKEKGICRDVTLAEPEVVEEMYLTRKLGPNTAHIFNQSLCLANQNKLEDTDWTWEWGSLSIKRGIKTVLTKAGVNVKELEKKYEDSSEEMEEL